MSNVGWRPMSIGADWVERLATEAESSEFVRIRGAAYGARESDGRMTSPYDVGAAVAGPVAVELSAEPALLECVSEVAESDVRFNSGTYVVYQADSFMGCHTDRRGCDVNLLFLLAGAPSGVEIVPSQRAELRGPLLRESHQNSGFVSGGIRVPLKSDGDGVAFVGSEIPHQRRPGSAPVLILTLCFAREVCAG